MPASFAHARLARVSLFLRHWDRGLISAYGFWDASGWLTNGAANPRSCYPRPLGRIHSLFFTRETFDARQEVGVDLDRI